MKLAEMHSNWPDILINNNKKGVMMNSLIWICVADARGWIIQLCACTKVWIMKVVSLHWSLGQSKGIKFTLTYWSVSTFGRHPDKKNYGQPLPLSLLVGLDLELKLMPSCLNLCLLPSPLGTESKCLLVTIHSKYILNQLVIELGTVPENELERIVKVWRLISEEMEVGIRP